MDEYFDIVDVKKEFLKNVGPQYQSTYAPQQLDIALYMLNDFCNNVSANGLVLMRQTQQPPVQPEYYPEPVPAYEPRFDPRQPYPQPMQPSYPTPQRPPYVVQQQPPNYPPQDPFEEYQPPQQFIPPQRPQPQPQRVQQQVNELNQGLQQQPRFRPQPLPTQQPMTYTQQDADLNPDKAKTFVDKIKEMRTPKKSDKINPEE